MRRYLYILIFTAVAAAWRSRLRTGTVPGSLAPYLPTPNSVVDEMLKAGD